MFPASILERSRGGVEMYDRTLISKASEPYLRNFKLLCESRCAEVDSPQVLLFACFPLPRARGLGGKSWSVREMDKEVPLPWHMDS